MKIYIDNDYKCHHSNDGTMREFDIPFFDEKCNEFINGFRYIPDGEEWERYDGVKFHGETISPRKPYSWLMKIQSKYDEVNEITKIITGEVSIYDER